jgi:hypothetical protein
MMAGRRKWAILPTGDTKFVSGLEEKMNGQFQVSLVLLLAVISDDAG